jgi:hypothetical protein
MSTDGQPRRTTPAIRRFEVWFGGIFLSIGLVALLVAAILFAVLSTRPAYGAMMWAFLGAPLGLGVVFSLLGGTFVLRGLAKVRTAERLLQSGTTTEATVVAVEPTNTRVNRRILWHVRYTYEDMYGTMHPGESGYLAPEDAQTFHVGDRAFVRYDPASPATSAWLGREELSGQI